jgi:hypothetical protein
MGHRHPRALPWVFTLPCLRHLKKAVAFARTLAMSRHPGKSPRRHPGESHGRGHPRALPWVFTLPCLRHLKKAVAFARGALVGYRWPSSEPE